MNSQNLYYLIDNDLHDLFDCYFCESCNKIVVQDCVRFEADSYFCPGCLENIPTSEAFSNNFCCKNCYCCFKCNATVYTAYVPHYNGSGGGENVEFKRFSCDYCGQVYFCNGITVCDSVTGDIKNQSFECNVNEEHCNTDLLVEIFNYVGTIIESLNRITDVITESTENKHLLHKGPILEKNTWLNKSNIKLLCDYKQVIDTNTKKNPRITLTQYLNNPEIINSCYICSKRIFSTYSMKLPLLEKKLCAQFSKRCFICKRLVIKPQLNPIAQPPFRINLSANLFMPNFKILSIEKNVSYKGGFYHILLKLRVENLMDRTSRIDFLGTSENIENNSNNLGDIEAIIIEPRSITIEPKWTPTSEQIQNQTQDYLRERRGRNKQRINIYVRNPPDSIKNNLKISGISNFKSPTGNDSTIMFTIFVSCL
ncbi:dynactin subunit p62 [Cryptosporidium bovis]|uniref:dynactin subunit p62 n=1 Tax=Cryptosporidium bovis TaxID=310047 RepID=UPI00351A7181|nr:dynactin subunit p62 [Cryptosporidium bovis]